ncbi:MAG: hypothetical protein Q8Q91_00515, partial [Candidatus Daviesbacteria bacterium]|nr:hypothetical protein [Candidatus Daviesbacteria bacterium]
AQEPPVQIRWGEYRVIARTALFKILEGKRRGLPQTDATEPLLTQIGEGFDNYNHYQRLAGKQDLTSEPRFVSRWVMKLPDY